MKNYFFYKLPDKNGYHEVHHEDCAYLPGPYHRYAIGKFSNCEEAIKEVESLFPMLKFDGCFFCSESCHNH